LLQSRVLVIGAGGLGSPLLLYLAAAGIGTIGIVDNDTIDLSNLQRQILHRTRDIGHLKAENGRRVIKEMNPDVNVIAHSIRFTPSNALNIIKDYDIIADGSDNFATRFLINDAAYFAKKILVSAAILRFDGQLSTFKSHKNKKEGQLNPCYRCIFPEPPPEGHIPSCSEAGVLGSLCGLMGSFQATEIIKEILQIGDSLAGSLLILDGLRSDFRKIKIKQDPKCPLCGNDPSIRNLSIHGK